MKSLDLKKFLTVTQIKSLKREAKKVMNGSLSLTKFKSLIRKMISSRSRSLGLKGGNLFTDAISYILSFFGLGQGNQYDDDMIYGDMSSAGQRRINRLRRGSM
jgi:hypothetical protein